MKLVRRYRKHVHTHCFDIDGDFSRRLDRIAVRWQTHRFGHLKNFRDWLNHAGLVVGHHHRNKGRLGQLLRSGISFHHAIGIHSRAKKSTPHRLNAAQHRAVLDRRNQRTTTARKPIHRMKRGVDAFRATTGEHDLAGIGTDQRRHLLPRAIDRRPRTLGLAVRARRIGMTIAQPRQHSVHHFGQQRSRRVGIKIDHPTSIPLIRPMATRKNSSMVTHHRHQM